MSGQKSRWVLTSSVRLKTGRRSTDEARTTSVTFANEEIVSNTSPEDLPRSRTGRVPKWVVDEAHGREPSELVPFRASTYPPGSMGRGRTGGRRGWRRPVGVMAVVAMVVGLAIAAERQRATPPARPFSNALEGGPSTSEVARTGPVPGFEEQAERLVPAPAAPPAPSGAARFSSRQPGTDSPVTWSPCRPVHYVVRPDNAPTGAAQLIDTAFAMVGDATGLVFVNDGPTAEAPTEDRAAFQPALYGNRWAPVLVSWPTADEIPDLGVDILGEAYANRVTTPDGTLAYVSGGVMLDPVKLGQLLSARGLEAARAVILHEVAHLVGLAHVNNLSQIMAPRSGRVMSFQSGDLAGLAAVGSGPCQPRI